MFEYYNEMRKYLPENDDPCLAAVEDQFLRDVASHVDALKQKWAKINDSPYTSMVNRDLMSVARIFAAAINHSDLKESPND